MLGPGPGVSGDHGGERGQAVTRRHQGDDTQHSENNRVNTDRLEHHRQDTQGTDTDQPKMIESPTFYRTNDP